MASPSYDVFPSFHGTDVRKKFLSHVLKEFKRKGINLFIDNDIKRGEFIGPELIKAIKGSKIAIVLLSKNYASSSRCLNELVEIMKQESGQIVITVFYEVDPTHVRKQTEQFGEVFRKTCEGKDKDKIEIWGKALEDVGSIAGYHISNWEDDASMIEKLAFDISKMLYNSTPAHDFVNIVGIENHMEKLKPLLQLDSNEVRMIGIWGPPLTQKTTIARSLFSILYNSFQNRAFMADIKDTYQKTCLDEHEAKLQLQTQILSKLLNQSDIVVCRHLGEAQQRLRNNKVLLIFDDVDCLAQVNALAEIVTWFGPGSRIIITTHDQRLLKEIKVNHIYKVNYPSSDEALQMFCMYAFQKNFPEDDFYELACEITHLVGELPLGLKVMGSFFRGLCKDKDRWSMEVSRLRNNLNGDIKSIFKFSGNALYDALCDEDKDLFLQIACFFYNWQDLSYVEKFLSPSFKDLRQRLHGLQEKSLIVEKSIASNSEYVTIEMHESLVQIGQNIVREELLFGKSGKHQFLNDYKDAWQMLTGENITENFYEENLRVVYDSGHPIIIEWRKFRFTCLDFTNNLEFLVELHLVSSNLEKLWEGTKLLRNLKILYLSYSINLKELPNLSMATNLEELNLKGCSSLVELPFSIGKASNLAELNLEGCSSLVSLPQLPESLSDLNAKNCKSLKKLDCSFGNAVNRLNFSSCISLSKEARDLIIQTSTLECANLPGTEVPVCFPYRGCGSCLTVELNEKHLPTSTKFKACILLVYKGEDQSTLEFGESLRVSCSITSKEKNAFTVRTPYSKDIQNLSTEHLYIFDIEAEEVTSTELDFTFELTSPYDWGKENISRNWEIKECGVLSVLGPSINERFGGYNKEICKKSRIIPYSVKGILSFVAIVFFLTRRRI